MPSAESKRRNPKGFMLLKARERAKRLGVPFTITTDDFEIPSVCPLLGVEMSPGVARCGDYSPTLDRIVPDKGYVPGNVWVISLKANRIKNNATPEELMLVATKVHERIYCVSPCGGV